MSRPITYRECGEGLYSRAGLRMLLRSLTHLNDFPYAAEQQRQDAVIRAGRMSIRGRAAQVEREAHCQRRRVPSSIAAGLTLHLARLCGIEGPLRVLVRSVDGTGPTSFVASTVWAATTESHWRISRSLRGGVVTPSTNSAWRG